MNLFKHFLLSLLFLMMVFVSKAQDIIIKVKKGTAKIGTTELNEFSKASSLKNTDIIEVFNSCLVMARQDVIVVELNAGKKYSYNDIKGLLKIKKESSTGGLVTVAFKDPIQKNNGPIKGSTTRGLGDYEYDFYFPFDSMMLIEENPKFYIGNKKTKITTKVTVKNIDNNIVYYDELPKGNSFNIKGLKEGNYEWTYSTEYQEGGSTKLTDFVNTFIVPSKAESKKIAKKVMYYKSELKSFSKDLQKVLIIEFYNENKIHFNLD